MPELTNDFLLVEAQDLSPSDEEYITRELENAQARRSRRGHRRHADGASRRRPLQEAAANHHYTAADCARSRMRDYHAERSRSEPNLQAQPPGGDGRADLVVERFDVRLDRIEHALAHGSAEQLQDAAHVRLQLIPAIQDILDRWEESDDSDDDEEGVFFRDEDSCGSRLRRRGEKMDELELKLQQLADELESLGLDCSGRRRHGRRKPRRPPPESLHGSDVDDIVSWMRSRPLRIRS